VINTDDAFGLALFGEMARRMPDRAPAAGRRPGARRALRGGRARGRRRRGLTLHVRSSWGDGELASAAARPLQRAPTLLAVLAVLPRARAYRASTRALARLATLGTVAGRMERLGVGERRWWWSTTPNAGRLTPGPRGRLRRALPRRLHCVLRAAAASATPASGPLMGEVAETLADRVIVTDAQDPARHEDTATADDRRPDPRRPARSRRARPWSANRARAIGAAVADALPGDIVLVAGKGHETTAGRATWRLPFSDRAVAVCGPAGRGGDALIRMSLSHVAAALEGRLLGGDASFVAVSTDSRHLAPGAAVRRAGGAALRRQRLRRPGRRARCVAAVVSRPVDVAMPCLLVPDTRVALGRLAALWRAACPARVVAVTAATARPR